MIKYIINFDPSTNNFIDDNGIIMFNWINPALKKYKKEKNDLKYQNVTVSLVDKGISVDDIVKLKDRGLL